MSAAKALDGTLVVDCDGCIAETTLGLETTRRWWHFRDSVVGMYGVEWSYL